MNKKIICLFIMLAIPFAAFAQEKANTEAKEKEAKAAPAQAQAQAQAQKVEVKRVSFNPTKRNPFLSKEEVLKIEQMRKAERRRLEEEAAERERLAREERKRRLQEQILKEELERYPARAVMYKITIDGILGKEAIVNGEVVGVGAKVLGAKVVAITDDSVWFVYKGQRFERKLPLL